MRSNDVYPSKYLKAEELDADLTVTIDRVEVEELESNDGKKQNKPVAYFKEVDKGLIINKTNWAGIAKQHGDESDDWVGKQITLTVMDVEAFGDIVSAIRVKTIRKVVNPVKPKTIHPSEARTPQKSDNNAGDVVTEFWQEVKKQGLERKQGLEVLANTRQDFAAALGKLRAGDVPY